MSSRLHALVPPDFQRSPRTGLTRAHWRAAGLYLVEQMFAALPSMDAPLLFPKVPGKSYPREGEPVTRTRAAEFEGFVRSLNLVAPLLQETPDLTVRGVRLLDYYHRELLALVRADSPRRVPLLSTLVTHDHEMHQMTCEFGGLSVILLLYPLLWETLAPADREALAVLLYDYAHGNTSGHNWRYFNLMMMLFLRHHRYPVREELWRTHLDALLALDAGQGWFRDAHFDYYNAWVFHLYAPVWCRFHGYQHEPEIAALMERQSRELMRTYPAMFARNGHMLMWGRSIAYRTGAISPIPAAYHFNNPPPLDPGWARRICSGNLLQFIERDDFLMNGVPALGFYGHFEPAIQPYSCAASPMWGHLNFLAMFSLPADHPFWTATETDGDWAALTTPDAVREVTLDGPGLHLVNRARTGHTELLSGKAEPDDLGYNRLAYHTAFPWEELDPAVGLAMHYTRRTKSPVTGEGHRMPVKVHWCGARGGVLYRQVKMSNVQYGTAVAIDLADVSLPTGTLRVDRPRLYLAGELRLCHYGLPHVDRPAVVEHRTVRGHRAITARIPGRQLALVALAGWDEIGATVHRGFNPEAAESTVLWAEWRHAESYPSLSPRITLLLHKTDDSPWTDDELCPVASCATERLGALGLHGARVMLNDRRVFEIDYTGIEGIKQD